MADENQTLERLSVVADRLSQVLEDNIRVAGNLRDVNRDAAVSVNNSQETLKQFAQRGSRALDNLARAGTAAGQALLQNSRSAASMNRSIGNLSQAISGVVQTLSMLSPKGLVGKAMMQGMLLLVDGLSRYAQEATVMADRLYAGYQGMARAGAAASEGMSGLFDDAKKLGFSMGELGEFVSSVTANSKDLALFGGAAFEGRKRLAAMGQELESNRESFFKLGLNMTDVTETMIGYIKQQRVIGQVNTQTTAQLAEGARRYLLEQDALTKLTGATRQEQEAVREQFRSQERFAGKLEEMRQQGRVREAAELEKLIFFINRFNREAGQGLADLSTGMVGTEAAAKNLMASQNRDLEVLQRVMAGEIDAAEAAQTVAKAHGDTARGIGVIMAQIGTYSTTMGNYAGDIELARVAEMNVREQLAKAIEEQTKQGGREVRARDRLLDQQGKLLVAFQDANKALETFIKAGISPAQRGLTALAKAFDASADKINKIFGITLTAEDQARRNEELGQATDIADNIDKMNKELENLRKQLTDATSRGDHKQQDLLREQIRKTEDSIHLQERSRQILEGGIKGATASPEFEQRANGSLGAKGSLIEDFGRGTPAMLHGREGVITEDQLSTLVKTSMAAGQDSTKEKRTAFENFVLGGKLLGSFALDLLLGSDKKPTPPKESISVPASPQDSTDVDRAANRYQAQAADQVQQQQRIAPLPTTNIINVPEIGRKIIESENQPRAETPGRFDGLRPEDYIRFTARTGSRRHFAKVRDYVARAFVNMAREYFDITGGQKLQVNSSFRSLEEQARLSAKVKAKPGESLHNFGRAIDIQSSQRRQLSRMGLIEKYGWNAPAQSTPHISMADGGIAEGPKSGYMAELHGKEAVIPLKDSALTMMIPSVDGLVDVTEDLAENIHGLRDDIRSMTTNLNQYLRQEKADDMQGRMVEILESINRNQARTADASHRMAQVAIN